MDWKDHYDFESPGSNIQLTLCGSGLVMMDCFIGINDVPHVVVRRFFAHQQGISLLL